MFVKKMKKSLLIFAVAILCVSITACKSDEQKVKEDNEKMTKLCNQINEYDNKVEKSSSFLENQKIREKHIKDVEESKYKFNDKTMNDGLEKYLKVQHDYIDFNNKFISDYSIVSDSDIKVNVYEEYAVKSKDLRIERMKIFSELNNKNKFKLKEDTVKESKQIVDAFEKTKTVGSGEEAKSDLLSAKVYSIVRDNSNSDFGHGKNIYRADIEFKNIDMGENVNVLDGQLTVPSYLMIAKDNNNIKLAIDDAEYFGDVPKISNGEKVRIRFALSTNAENVKKVKFTLNPYVCPVNIEVDVDK